MRSQPEVQKLLDQVVSLPEAKSPVDNFRYGYLIGVAIASACVLEENSGKLPIDLDFEKSKAIPVQDLRGHLLSIKG